jgi:hypothetical protein
MSNALKMAARLAERDVYVPEELRSKALTDDERAHVGMLRGAMVVAEQCGLESEAALMRGALAIIARLQQPAVVLAEAERLLREAGVTEIELTEVAHGAHNWVNVQSGKVIGNNLVTRWEETETLAEAYAALKGGEDSSDGQD